MTTFTTYPMPINLYGDTKQVIEVHNWQAGYADYLKQNGLVLDKQGNPVKKEGIENG